MSETEDPNIPAETPAPEVTEAEAVVYEEATVDLGEVINQMRLQVVGLGLAFLLLSLSVFFYVFRQTSKFRMQRDDLTQRAQALQKDNERFMPVISDLAAYAQQQPALRTLFERHGMQLGPATNQAAGASR